MVERRRARTPFEDVVAEHGTLVMRVCTAVLGPVDAEDAWSDTFLAALRTYPDLRPDSNVRGWLVTIAHSKSIDATRRRVRTPVPSAQLPERSAVDETGAFDDHLRDALLALPPKQQRAVMYRHLAGMSYAEIGELIGSSEAAARRSAADGLQALRRRYEEDET